MANQDQIKGRIKKAAGDLTDDDRLRREGQADEQAGKLKEGVRKGKEKVEDAIDAVRDRMNKD